MNARWLKTAAVGLVLGASLSTANAADYAPPGRTIAYAVSDLRFGFYETADAKEECPQGLNVTGPREIFKTLFPDDGTKRTIVDTQLEQVTETWWPATSQNDFPFKEAGGKISLGLNLDGKVKPSDFTSPDGTPGIDNQLFRATGCVSTYRTGNAIAKFDDDFFKRNNINRIMIVLTDVDSLENDDDVTITTYRGRDGFVNNATGKAFLPGSTQRLDLRWGKEFIHSAKGKIVNGVLTTEPMEVYLPHDTIGEAIIHWVRDGRFQLKLSPEKAEGVVGGYVDIDTVYRNRNRQWSPHHLSYGYQSPTDWYKAMRRLADAYPDPVTGENTAISAAYDLKLIQVRVVRDEEKVATTSPSTNVASAR